jgi:hypothetical protein
MDFASLVKIMAVLNKSIDIFLLGAFLLTLVVWDIYSLAISIQKNVKKESQQVEQDEKDRRKDIDGDEKSLPSDWGMSQPNAWTTAIGKALYLWGVSVALQALIILFFWFAPSLPWMEFGSKTAQKIVEVLRILAELLIRVFAINRQIYEEALRWLYLYVLFGSVFYFFTKKFGEKRGLNSMLGHLTVLLLGWLLGRWFGILFVSLPLLGIYYYIIYRFAEILIPASDPEDLEEKKKRFAILAWYMWGSQYPIIIVDDQTGMNVETRIEGSSFQDWGMPGYIWTHMPQAVGITNGTNFSRVEGPGAIYTKMFERPQDVIDLRTQLRTTEIEAITQDGFSIKAIVFTSFGVDRQPWERSLYNRLKHANPMLRGGMLPDHGNSHFKYSRPRVRAVLSMEGVKTNLSGPVGAVSWRWDEQVMNMVAETARRVISEIPLTELWLPDSEKDGPEVSALDIVAAEISKRLTGTLQEQGVRLYAARVVNYFSLKDTPTDKFGEFTKRQIPAWQARWEQRVRQKLAETRAKFEQKQLDATALARSTLLTSIAESLDRTGANNHDLTRYLIAMRFLGTLDDMIRQEPELAAGEKGKTLREQIDLLKGLYPPKV